MDYVILAGGHGSRFRNDGIDIPKPLIPVAGTPMVERLVMQLCRHNASTIHIAVNPRLEGLEKHVAMLASKGLPVKCVPVVTENSFSSLLQGAQELRGTFVGITCDAIFSDDEFSLYLQQFTHLDSAAALMGVTTYVEDDSPLYVDINCNGVITDYRCGGKPFQEKPLVSAGIYGLNADILKTVAHQHPTSLNDFQILMTREPSIRLLPFLFDKVFDIDNIGDLRSAEAYIQSLQAI